MPSGLIKVLTFAHLTSYIWRTASLMFSLVALMSTKKTSVLISSIFFMADSVVTGHWMILYLSLRSRLSTDRRGYFGSRFLIRVFGRKKCTLVRTFRCFLATEPLTAFATLPAFFVPAVCFSPSAVAVASAFFLPFGAMAVWRGGAGVP